VNIFDIKISIRSSLNLPMLKTETQQFAKFFLRDLKTKKLTTLKEKLDNEKSKFSSSSWLTIIYKFLFRVNSESLARILQIC